MVSATALVRAVVFLGLGIAATTATLLPAAAEIGAAFDGTTAGSTNECADEEASCGDGTTCLGCLQSEVYSYYEEATSGDVDRNDYTCAETNAELCALHGTNSECNANAEYAAVMECYVGTSSPDCDIELCGISASGLTGYSGAAVLISASIAGLFAVALGTTL